MEFISNTRSRIYSHLFDISLPISTASGFQHILSLLPRGSKILDVGCGDGIYFTDLDICDLIRIKDFRIQCIDIDKRVVDICKQRVTKNFLTDYVKCSNTNIFNIEEKYDAVLFVESFPVISHELFSRMIKYIKDKTNRILLYHNLLENNNLCLDIIKPRLKYITLVDFGRTTTVEEMHQNICDWKLNRNYSIYRLISCRCGDLNLFLNLPILGDYIIEQYVIDIKKLY